MAKEMNIVELLHSQKSKCDIDDEAWELDSGGSTRSASNSSSHDALVKTLASSKVPVSLPSMTLGPSESDSESDSESEDEILTSPSRRPFGYQPPQRPTPTAGQVLAKLPPPEAAPKSLQGQVAYLRQENKLLRDALSRLQQEAEDMSERHAQGENKSLDFAHLLELAREFGDLCNSHDAAEGEEDATSNFCISTPRDEKHGSSIADDTETNMKSDLEFSRREVARLEAVVAEREAELQTLRPGPLEG